MATRKRPPIPVIVLVVLALVLWVVFLVAGKKAQKAGGRIALCNLQPTVREILAIAGFDRILTTAANRGEGLAKLI